MSVIALVPSRSGSKGVKNKNLRAIGGRSLLNWAAQAAQQSQMIGRGYISTDSLLHEKLGIKYGLTSLGLRSPHLSGDDAKTVDVLIDFLNLLGLPDDDNYLVLLQPTSPLRDGALIDQCIEMARRTKEPVVTVAPIIEPHPYKTLIEKDGLVQPLRKLADLTTPRQKLPKAFLLTGRCVCPALFSYTFRKYHY